MSRADRIVNRNQLRKEGMLGGTKKNGKNFLGLMAAMNFMSSFWTKNNKGKVMGGKV